MTVGKLVFVGLAALALASVVQVGSSALAGEPAAATKPASTFVLSSFEPGGPDFVKLQSDGQIVGEHATDGQHATKIKSDQKGFPGLEISDVAALSQFRNYRWLKVDIFNPQDVGVGYGVKIADTHSYGYNSRFNEDSLVAFPGRSTLAVDLNWLLRQRDGKLDTSKLTSVSVFLCPSKNDVALFFDNVRLEGSPEDQAPDTTVFGFEKPDDLKNWTIQPSAADGKAPVKMELSDQNATPGKHSLKLTYWGGKFPAVITKTIPLADWSNYLTLKADITVSRDCLVKLSVMQERSNLKEVNGHYEKLCRLFPGKNQVVERTLQEQGYAWMGKVVSFQIAMYEPNDGDSIYVDNVRLSAGFPPETTPYRYLNPETTGTPALAPFQYAFPGAKFKVLGTDLEVKDGNELAGKLKSAWVMPKRQTLDEIEADFTRQCDALKKDHPRAVLVTMREGQKGYDPSQPDKEYAGWHMCSMYAHAPAPSYIQHLGINGGGAESTGLALRMETSMMKLNLSSIPRGANILAARLILVKTGPPAPQSDDISPLKPAFFCAEPCNRPWVEAEVDGFQYAKGKYWKEVCGMDWRGDDPDFSPLFIAVGQAQYDINYLDFTAAIKYWTQDKHENNGWILSCPLTAMEFTSVFTQRAKALKSRPAMMIMYESKD